MRTLEKRQRLSRRGFLAGSGMTALGTVALSAGATLFDPKGAWALSVTALKPETMATLIQMARDIYPHDRLTDAFYAKAVASYDTDAAKDPKLKALIETGVAEVDRAARARGPKRYVDLKAATDRVAVLHVVEGGALFTKLRAGLVTGLYNQPEVWAKFGYEGPSAPEGGYLYRGFDDIDWLPAV
ncbi:MAG TPA: hypothetical protein VNT30_22045 [Stellaceae bacterium]|nr:hypothetical protein [Stellaceae bacterium]